MRRRLFLSSLVCATATLLAPVSAIAGLQFELNVNAQHVEVRGNPDDVIQFMYRYQDALWADWRSNSKLVERYRDHEEYVRKNGKIHVSVHGIGQQAFNAASIPHSKCLVSWLA